MSARAQLFVFESYKLYPEAKRVTLKYSVDQKYHFSEEWVFDFDWSETIHTEALDRALFNLHILAGVSYYKAHLASRIEVHSGPLDQSMVEYFKSIYQGGLGQFFYTNKLDPNIGIPFQVSSDQAIEPVTIEGLHGALVPIGGGKDSIVTAELLKQHNEDFSSWVINHSERLRDMLDTFDAPHLPVRRKVDPLISELNQQGVYNGHVPITAIVTAAAVVSAILSGKKSVVLSNEASSSEGNVEYRGTMINHQFSKSYEVEKMTKAYIKEHISPDIEYFSLLRPMTELAIAERFAKVFDTYKHYFSSCNENFHLTDTGKLYWCGHCPKCAFVFLMFTPFVPKEKLLDLFGGEFVAFFQP